MRIITEDVKNFTVLLESTSTYDFFQVGAYYWALLAGVDETWRILCYHSSKKGFMTMGSDDYIPFDIIDSILLPKIENTIPEYF